MINFRELSGLIIWEGQLFTSKGEYRKGWVMPKVVGTRSYSTRHFSRDRETKK